MNDIPYREISLQQKEWLFVFVRWWAEMPLKPLKEIRSMIPCHRPMVKKDFLCPSSYGIKHILEGDRTPDVLPIVFKDIPDFQPFYCTNATFKQAMEDCGVRHTKRYCGNYYFLGGYENV